MSTTATASSVAAGTGTPRLKSQATSPSEKFSAAKALPRKPDRVMATWMVAKKRAGWLVRRARRAARLSPEAASRARRVSFMEMTAISAQANTALRPMRAACSKSMRAREFSKATFLLEN